MSSIQHQLRDRGSFATTLKFFRERTTAHGIPHISNAQGTVKKIFWCMITVGCLIFLTYHIASIGMYFTSRPVNVNVNLVKETQMTFPAVTVCNINPIKSSALSNSPALYSVLGSSTPSGSVRKRRSTSSIIATYGGTGNFAPCVFPFIFSAISYNSCITSGALVEARCGTTSNVDVDNSWGICILEDQCPNTIYLEPDGGKTCYWNPEPNIANNFQYAVDKCASLGAKLVIMNSPEKQTHLQSILTMGRGDKTWIWLTKASKTSTEWLWRGVQAITWADWGRGYPKNPTPPNLCAVVNDKLKMKDNTDCVNDIAFTVCEKTFGGLTTSASLPTTTPTTAVPTTHVPTTEPLTTQRETKELTTEVTTTRRHITSDSPSSIPISQSTMAQQSTTSESSTTQTPATSFVTLPITTPIPTQFITTVRTDVASSTTPPIQSEVREDFQKRDEVMEVLADLAVEEKKSLGYSAEELVVDCEYAGYGCQGSQFAFFYDPMQGNCYVFNSGWNDTLNTQKSYRPGRRHALKLILYINQDEYVENLGEEAGVTVVVHPQNQMPFPQEDGILAPPGKLTSVGIRQVEMSRVGAPYGNCVDPKLKNHTRNVYEDMYPVNYSITGCFKTCYQKLMIELCGCMDPQYPTVGQAFKSANICTVYQKERCKATVDGFYKDNSDVCECPSSCSEKMYVAEVSNVLWPSNVFENKIISYMANKLVGSTSNLTNPDVFRKNFLKVEVFFQDFSFEIMQEIPAYEEDSLFSNLGGILGLWIGCSVISLFELIELVMDLITYAGFAFSLRKQNNKMARSAPAPLVPAMKVIQIEDPERETDNLGFPRSHAMRRFYVQKVAPIDDSLGNGIG